MFLKYVLFPSSAREGAFSPQRCIYNTKEAAVDQTIPDDGVLVRRRGGVNAIACIFLIELVNMIEQLVHISQLFQPEILFT